MEKSKLRVLLSKLEATALSDESEYVFVNLNDSLAKNLRANYGANGACGSNSVCSNNTSCSGNGTCSGNVTCNSGGGGGGIQVV